VPHCLAGPLIAGGLPLIGMAVLSAKTEWLLMTASFGTSALALANGCIRTRRQWRAVLPFLFGVCALLGVRITGESDGLASRIAVAAGAMSVVVAHVLNIGVCRRANRRVWLRRWCDATD
jgi:hypothetical protein